MTDTALKPLPDDTKSTGYADRAREAAGQAQEKVSAAATAAVDAAKERPYAAAGIAAGVAVAAAGAAFGIAKLLDDDRPATKKSAAAKAKK